MKNPLGPRVCLCHRALTFEIAIPIDFNPISIRPNPSHTPYTSPDPLIRSVYHWAKLSDKIGRKPVIMLGLAGVAISSALYGYSTKFWQLIVTRSLSGALNGNVAVSHARRFCQTRRHGLIDELRVKGGPGSRLGDYRRVECT